MTAAQSRRAQRTFTCYGIACDSKKQRPRNAFSEWMLTGVGAEDRKCDPCVAAAQSRHAGPQTADRFLCHGVKCKGKKRQPRAQFSKRQIKNGGARKICSMCAPADKTASDGGTGSVGWYASDFPFLISMTRGILKYLIVAHCCGV